MTKQNHKTGFLVAAMVFSAIFLRVLGKRKKFCMMKEKRSDAKAVCHALILRAGKSLPLFFL